jgi:2-oxoglutarate dehydrogenase E2 component (dihydrolipoamide succinyltransferase)
VRRLLREHGLDAAQVTGSGRGGRITVQDIELLLGSASRPAVLPSSRLIPHSAMRRSIAEHMVKSVATAPHVTAVFEADLSAVIRHREAHRKAFTYTGYFVRASVAALQAVPEVNSRWRDQGLELYEDCNIGIGTALPGGGLIVPVLRQAQDLDLAETARRLEDLTTRARAGSLEPRDVQGGTFTISNHGVSGSLLAAPIVINQPQSAILGIGKMEQRVRVAPGGGFEARPMVYVTLTIDHRALDGFQANAFLSRWVEVIEQWS